MTKVLDIQTYEKNLADLWGKKKECETSSYAQAKFDAVVQSLDQLGDPPSGVYEEFVDGIREELESGPQRMALAKEAVARGEAEACVRLPVRNQTHSAAPYVELHTEHHGLIHGGIVRAGNSVLNCKAYRLFLTIPYYIDKGQRIQHIEVLAAVVEQFDEGGKLVDKWSTAEYYLKQYYVSTSQELPPFACNTKGTTTFGFYAARLTNEQFEEMVLEHPEYSYLRHYREAPAFCGDVEVPETNEPCADYYRSAVLSRPLSENRMHFSQARHFDVPPLEDEALENALYQPPSETMSAGKGFVINTPYISVFCPSASPGLCIVAAAGVARTSLHIYSILGGMCCWARTFYARDADPGWDIHTFEM